MRFFDKKIGSLITIAVITISSSTPSFAGHKNYINYNNNDYYQNTGYYDDRDDQDNRNDRRYRAQRCDKGTGGLIIGAIAGGLLGRTIVSRRGDKTTGAIIGAGVGALAGRAIDKSDSRRC